ncbi:MAG: hypothetical protein JJ969_15085 [Rhizobiaceae bacterium]|nr:hypothetical protein [Rhizobiaceae bacterium]
MASTKPTDTDAIGSGTGRSWNEWQSFLEAIGARDMPHPEIARRVEETGDANSWWAQTITVAYEQHIGRRKPGQRSDGSFEVAATRTIEGDVAEHFEKLRQQFCSVSAFDGVALAGEPRTSVTPKRSYWRCDLADGTGVAFALEQKSGAKVLVAATHRKLASDTEAARWRAFWKDYLASAFPSP